MCAIAALAKNSRTVTGNDIQMNKDFKVIDLTHTIHSAIPGWEGNCGFKMSVTLDYNECTPPYLFKKHSIETPTGIGTHIDSPAHCIPGGKTVDLIDINNLVTDCIVIKVSAENDSNFIITKKVIEEFEEKNGKISPNSFVLFCTGWNIYWETPEKYINNHEFPSVHEDVAKLLIERDISGLGIDTLSADTGKNGFPVHNLILGAGKYLVENIAHANDVPSVGAKICVMPTKIKDAAEAPVRLVVLI